MKLRLKRCGRLVQTMDKYTATEQAYKHGYEKGYADGERNAVTLCKNCQFSIPLSEKYKCRSQMGLNRTVHPNEFCSWGEAALE